MTLPSKPPRVHRGCALPPGVPPPKKGELHLRVEGFDWQNMAFEARPPACCSLLISWWGQASYNSLLMPLSASLAFSPATAVFSVHSSAKRFERYLQDMGFLELTLVNGNTTFDLKDVSRTMLGKLSVSVSNLAEGHSVRGSYPIFANGHRLIGSLKLSITVTFYEANAQPPVKPNRNRMSPRRETSESHSVSSFERNEDDELVLTGNSIRLYPRAVPVDRRLEPIQRDLNFNSNMSSNSERSSGSSVDREIELAERSLHELKSSTFEETVQSIVTERLSHTKSSMTSSESEVTAPDVDSSFNQIDNGTNEAPSRSANPYLDPPFCEMEGLEAEKMGSVCESDDSSLSCVISKSARLMRNLACESTGQPSVKSADRSCREMAPKDSNRPQDMGRTGSHGTRNSMQMKVDEPPSKSRKDNVKTRRLDKFSMVRNRNSRDDTDAHNSSAKLVSVLSTIERIRNLRQTSKNSEIKTLEEIDERDPQLSLRSPQQRSDEAQRGGLSDLLLPSTSGVPRSTCYTNNLYENQADPINQNVWSTGEEQAADQVVSKGVSFIERKTVQPVSSGTQPPLSPNVDFGFDPGGNRNSSRPSLSTLPESKTTNLAIQLKGEQTRPTGSYNRGGRSYHVQQSCQPKTNAASESGNWKFCSPCASPQSVIYDIKKLIKRAEACRDTLKKPEFSKTRLMTTSPSPSAESIRLSRSHSAHSFGLNSSSDDLFATILSANKGHDKDLLTKIHAYGEDLGLEEDVDDAADVMTAALLEALYVDDDKTANIPSAAAEEPASVEARYHMAETEGDWHDEYVRARKNVSANPMNWLEEDILNVNGMSVQNRISAQGVANQPFSLRITVGKLVLCGPMVRDLADSRPSKGSLMHSTCTCSLTVSFPALVPPYSSKQRICVSPVSFGTREAVFDHQSQLSWNTLPDHDIQDWQTRDFRVAVLLSWQRFDTMECAGYISLEKVVTSMPGVYRTSLALVLTSHLAHKRSRSRSPSKGRSPKKAGKQTMKSGLKHPAGASKRNCSENSERQATAQKDAVARVDVMLQLCRGNPFPANKHEPFRETQSQRLSNMNGMKPKPRLLTNSTPVSNNVQDWRMHVIIHDVVNCLEDVLSSTQYSSYMRIRAPHLLLVIKSSPKESAQVPFPQRFGLRKEIPGNSTDAILPAPTQLLKTNKAVVFIEVWHDVGVHPTRKLVGLIKTPLLLAPACAEGPEIVAEGLHQVFDLLQCSAVGTVMVTVTLGRSQQLSRLSKQNRAATLIQRRVREYMSRGLGPDKSIEITRVWDTAPKCSRDRNVTPF